MSHVVSVSQEELRARRSAVLARFELSYEELRDRALAGALVGDEWEAWQDICDIDFLLGDD